MANIQNLILQDVYVLEHESDCIIKCKGYIFEKLATPFVEKAWIIYLENEDIPRLYNGQYLKDVFTDIESAENHIKSNLVSAIKMNKHMILSAEQSIKRFTEKAKKYNIDLTDL